METSQEYYSNKDPNCLITLTWSGMQVNSDVLLKRSAYAAIGLPRREGQVTIIIHQQMALVTNPVRKLGGGGCMVESPWLSVLFYPGDIFWSTSPFGAKLGVLGISL